MRVIRKKGVTLLIIIAMLLSLFPPPVINANPSQSPQNSSCNYITVDGNKDLYWDSVPVLAESATKGYENMHINNLRITHDCTYLYYYVDAINVPNWGDPGVYFNLAVSVDGGIAGTSTNSPDGYPYNFSGASVYPDFHIVNIVKNNNELNTAKVVSTQDMSTPLADLSQLNDAQFAVDITKGFEGRVPLSLLGLTGNESLKFVAVLSGNNGYEHGAFDVIPESMGNPLAETWDESANPNVLSIFSDEYILDMDFTNVNLLNSNPLPNATNIRVDLEEIVFTFSDTVTEDASFNATLESELADVIQISHEVLDDELVITLEETLEYGTEYTLTVDSGSLVEYTDSIILSFTTEQDPALLNTYNFYYYRYDNAQSNWDLWVWEDNKDGFELDFTGTDSDGFATVTFSTFANKLNFITRPGNWDSQEVTRSITMPLNENEVDVFVIQNDPSVYTDRSDIDFSARIVTAFMDSPTTIDITTTQDVNDLTAFTLVDGNNTSAPAILLTAVKLANQKYRLTVANGSLVDVQKYYKVQHSEINEGILTFRGILDSSQYYYAGNDLGQTIQGGNVSFKVWAPTAENVYLRLYNDAGDYVNGKVVNHGNYDNSYLMQRDSTGTWSVSGPSSQLLDRYYMYEIIFADGTSNYVVDPYAKAVSANGQRSYSANLSDSDPAGWQSDSKPPFINDTDAIIYELHVRDFSISNDSNVSANNKGKFTAFTETGLVDNDGNKLGIDHLADLGITHVHLLPVYDFATVDETVVNDPASTKPKFNWGYDPQNYNVPEGSYSTDPADPYTRLNEFKQMVKALHEKDIRVVMDVVYNHTFEIENGPFDKIVPGYYYRMDNNGTFSNGSGVGNEVATERPMVRKYIKDSVRYWAEEYNVDGFRFDLMGIIDTRTMRELTEELHNEVDPSILIYGEPWMGGSTPLPYAEQTLKGSQKDLNFAVFNDNYRSAIKGDSDGANKGFATGDLSNISGVINGIKGATYDFTNAPSESINYVTAHDNLNLWDKVLKTQNLFTELNMLNIINGELIGGGDVDTAVANAQPYRDVNSQNVFANETVRRSLLANGMVLTAQGIPFIHAGDELLRTKYGDHNSYRSPDSVNMIRWSNKATFTPINNYYKGLIELRKNHPAFRLTTKAQIDDHLTILKQADGVVAFKLGEFANGDIWKNIIVIYNGNSSSTTFNLPTGNWNIVVNDEEAGVSTIGTPVTGTVSVPSISMMVLYDEATQYTPVPTSIEVHLPKVAIEANKTLIATATVKDQNGNIMPNVAVTWSSSNTAVATINTSGRITTVANGQTNISASIGQLSNEKGLTVATLVPATIELTGNDIVYQNMTEVITATVKDQFGQRLDGETINWSSSNSLIAIVDHTGKVTGKTPGTATITATIGAVQATFDIEVLEYVTRYIVFEYTRSDTDYSDWDMWLWNTGIQDGAYSFDVRNDKAYATVEVAPNTTQVGYIVRKGGNSWLAKDVDHDRFVNIRLDESYVVVKVTSGVSETTQTPRIISPEINQGNVTFRYRDEAAYRAGEHHTVEDVYVLFDGTQYVMNYDATGEFFYKTINNIVPGEYVYQFKVTKNGQTVTINDPKNTVNGESKVIYQLVTLDGSATVSPTQFDYNSHSILSVSTTTDINDISEIYADLTSLGGPAKVNIDKEILELTLSVTDSTTTGVKTIPVTFVDINQETYTTQVDVTITSRQVNGTADFDWDEARIYFMVTDRFKDGDASNNNPNNENYDTSHGLTYHGGDIQGVIDSLDYLEDLGINTIWLTPIVDNIDWNVAIGQPWEYQYGYHGYWAKDFTRLDEHLGDINTFKTLIDEAHDRGIKIMVDVVLNHAGYGMDSTKPPVATSNYPTSAEQAIFDGMIRTNPNSGNDLTGELAGLPDFRTEDPAVRDQLIQWQVDWLSTLRTNRGDTIDYYRVDTVKHVENTTWQKFKVELTKVNPQFKLIGEVFGASVNDQRGYLGTGMMDSLLDFNFKNIAKDFIDGNIDSVETKLGERNNSMNNVVTLGQFLSSHDEDGFLKVKADNDLGKQKIAASLQITAKGQPVIYYGEELAMSGRNANFGEGIYDENRYDMPWSEINDPDRSVMLDHYTKLLQARKSYSKVFSKGSRTVIAGGDSEGFTLFKRQYGNDKVFVGINVTNSPIDTSLTVDVAAGERLIDLYSGQLFTVDSQQNVSIQIPARAQGGTVLLVEYDGPIEYTVSFDVDGGSAVADVIANENTTIAEPTAPTKVGYTFAGWYKEASHTTAWNFATDIVTANMTLYAKWTLIPIPTYTVSFEVNGGSVVADVIANENTTIAEPIAPTKAGYTFAGWYKETSHTTAWNFATDKVTANMTLYAKWTLISRPSIPSTNGDTNTSGVVVVSNIHVVNNEYSVTLDENQHTVQVDINVISLPLNIRTGNANVTLTLEQLALLGQQDKIVNLKVNALTNDILKAVESWSKKENVRFNTLGSINVSSSTSTDGATNISFNIGNDITPRPYVYEVLEDGSLQFVSSNLDNGMLTFEGDLSTNYIVGQYTKSFTDMNEEHWAYEVISEAVARGLIEGKSAEAFAPSDQMTRAEFTSIITTILGLELTNSHDFDDIPSGSWYEQAIASANNAGIIKGISDAIFNPGGSLTREEMAVIIARAISYQNVDTIKLISDSTTSFKDEAEVSDWAKDSIQIATSLGLIQGKPGNNFDPKGKLTRAEAIKVLIGLVNLIEAN